MYEEWKQIENTKYEVSNLGRFRKKNKKGYRYIKPFKKHNSYVIKVNDKEKNCSRLVAHYFIRALKSEEVVHHKNHLQFDNFYRNLEILTRSELGKRTGYISKSKRVVLVEGGEIKRMYRSGRECERKLFLSRQTISDYCNNRTKKKMYNLMWEDDYFDKLEKEGR